jgi:dimethylamine corrinoid protein
MAMHKQLVEAVSASGLPGPPRVLVGGAPTTRAWAEEIGAGWAENAQAAVAEVERLLG